MEGDSVRPETGDGATAEVLALAKVVTRLRAEIADLEGVASVAAVVERAKGVLMAEAAVSADAAYRILSDRAERRRRTLLEECWITLSRAGSREARPERREAASEAAVRPPPYPSPSGTGRHLGGDVREAGPRVHLARLADGLADARTADDVAELLRAVLGDAEDVDAVMIYRSAANGSLELAGHAGIEATLAAQWSHIPPLGGVAALEATATREGVWLEDLKADDHLLIGDPPERWPTRAWLPVPGPAAPVVVGFFRSRAGPFDPATRALLRRSVRLCGGRLRAGPDADRPGGPQEDAEAVQRVLDTLPGPAVLLTPLRSAAGEVEDYRIDAAAPESVDVAGRRGRELVGRRVLETYPTVAGTALWDAYRDTLSTGTAYESEPFTHEEVTAGVPERSVYSVRVSPLEDRLVVSWIRHDGGEHETRRLAELQRLGNLGWVGWDLTTDEVTWSDQVYTVFDRAPERGPIRMEDLPGHLAAADAPRVGAAVRRLLAGGPAVDEPFRIPTASGVRHLRIVAEAHADADGAPVEVHGFFQDLTALRDAELALVESERANLVQRGMLKAERAVGARLQDTLLPVPEQSLELAGLCVDVAYVAADSGLNVGGDWYSAIELPDESALFVVGDVAGHGLPAVGTMAQLRFYTKGMTVTGSALPVVLGRLNRLLLHTAAEPDGATATMVMGRYQPWDRRLTWVRAGHLPPLLVRDGAAEFLSQPEGCLLGATFDSQYGQATLDLLPGDHLLFYTDGLVEVPGEDILVGLERLAGTVVRLLREGGGDTLARTLAALRPGNRDDICVLDIHIPDDS
ncbi:PP2C family protein-serine/threonine phosphatase [Streptomyces showdoensis]|uniref:Phosphatase n=1 Tax=Streptomyces showdoensis TaxID=68268 RepID=A0A2P2GWI9_STREW|nr:PP2C family protein-serine/threonine phosphatase [Streptomyces showdoensis]KKZ75275.1 phosphatase [Streptomyces showdoensis]